MGIFSKSIERRLYFVSLWSIDIGVFFCDFTSCIISTHCQTNRNQDKKITPLMTLTDWAVLFTHKLATVFSTVYIRVELQLGSFCIFIIPELQKKSNNVTFCTFCCYSHFVYGTLSS